MVDDIIEGGVDIINLQDLVNGADWIGGKFRGKTCVDLDIDRQSVTLFGTPEQIDAHNRNCVETGGCKAGGLMMIYGLYPGVRKCESPDGCHDTVRRILPPMRL